MKRSNHRSHGFSLPEVLIASSLLFTFATLSVGSYRDHIQHEQIKASSNSAQAWLEDVSRIAQQFNTHCLLEVNLGSKALQARQDNPEDCAIETPHMLSSDVCVVKDHDASDDTRCKNIDDNLSIEITPRGTAVVGQELELGTSGIDTKRCLLITEPLGLIRSGIRSISSRCDYSLES